MSNGTRGKETGEMDSVVETIVWVALLGGTGIILLLQLPRIVIWCLEIVERLQKVRFHRKMLSRRHADTDEPALHSQEAPPHN